MTALRRARKALRKAKQEPDLAFAPAAAKATEAFQALGISCAQAAQGLMRLADALRQLDLPDELDHLRSRGRWLWRTLAAMPLTEDDEEAVRWAYYNAPMWLLFPLLRKP